MTLSRERREQDLETAIKMMMAELGDNYFGHLFAEGDKPPYDQILTTTWRKMDRAGFIKDRGLKRYQLTAKGWLYGVETLGLQNERNFRNQMEKLAATLKGYVKGRKQDKLVTVHQASKDSSVSIDFIRNAIGSRLLDIAFRGRGAEFLPDDKMQHYLLIPLDYGLEP